MAVTPFLPGWTFVDLGPDGGPFDEMSHPKVILHTTEGSTLEGAEAAYKAWPPHLGYHTTKRTKRQYVRLDRHSYALRNPESEDEFCIQVEMVGFASQTHLWTPQVYQNIHEDIVVPLRDAIGVPDVHLNFMRADQGIVLASKRSPIRLRPSELRAFSGWMGHQHAPGLADDGSVLTYGDEHWDPGGFLIELALEGDDVSLAEDERNALMSLYKAHFYNNRNELYGDGSQGDQAGLERFVELQQGVRLVDDKVDALAAKIDQISVGGIDYAALAKAVNDDAARRLAE